MTKPLEAGWIPEGWERGDKLYIHVSMYGIRLSRNLEFSLYASPVAMTECLFHFPYSYKADFDKWLKWWYNEPPIKWHVIPGDWPSLVYVVATYKDWNEAEVVFVNSKGESPKLMLSDTIGELTHRIEAWKQEFER